MLGVSEGRRAGVRSASRAARASGALTYTATATQKAALDDDNADASHADSDVGQLGAARRSARTSSNTTAAQYVMGDAGASTA